MFRVLMSHGAHAGGMNKEYGARNRSIQFNLADKTNPDFRAKVLRGDLEPQKLMTMHTQDMASEVRSEATLFLGGPAGFWGSRPLLAGPVIPTGRSQTRPQHCAFPLPAGHLTGGTPVARTGCAPDRGADLLPANMSCGVVRCMAEDHSSCNSKKI